MSYQPVNIYCASCGAPASFDIQNQVYRCAYCGAQTGIRESLEEKKGFRQFHRRSLESRRQYFPLTTCACTGCGATVAFPENEALTTCAFCGRALARREYLKTEDFPEVVIPFRIPKEQAQANLAEWCQKNSAKREAKELQSHIGELQGCYLPYEMLKGPTTCSVRRDERIYQCRGFLDGSFVNTSKQLDNLLLDGMEPYDLSDMREFDFAYLAGQRVKIRDLNDKQVADRVRDEVSENYLPTLSKTMETMAIHIQPNTDALVQLSAVLPAYYLKAGETLAAVNGQTGKVAVRESKDRFLLPWWLRPIGWTILLTLVILGFSLLLGAELRMALVITGLITIFFLIVLFTAYHDKFEGEKRWRLSRRIFTSDNSRQPVSPPIFFERIDGQPQPVEIRFSAPLRVAGMLLGCLAAIFLPLIVAFILNGFSAEGLTIGGAGVWLCIMVPVVPIYYVKFGRLELYNHPAIRRILPDGRRVRYREKAGIRQWYRDNRGILKTIVIASLIALGLLAINVYLILHWNEI